VPNFNTSTTLDAELQKRGFGSQETQSGGNDLLNASFKYKQTDIKSTWRLKIFIATGGGSGGGPTTVGGFQVPGQGAAAGGGGAPNKTSLQEFDLANVITYTRGTEYYAVIHFGKQGGDLWCRVEHSGDPAKKLVLDKPVFVGVGPDGKSYFVKLSPTFGDTVVGVPEKMPKPEGADSDNEGEGETTTTAGPAAKLSTAKVGGFLSGLGSKVSAQVKGKASGAAAQPDKKAAKKTGAKKKRVMVLKEVYQSESTDSDSDAPPPPPDE